MRTIRIVTSFIKHNDKLLILKRSEKVRSMKGLWAGVSGIIEGDEKPLDRARTEILEEVGIAKDQITLVNTAREMVLVSPQYPDHKWQVFPFLFLANAPTVRLNWENSDFRWTSIGELKYFKTVPGLYDVLLSLL